MAHFRLPEHIFCSVLSMMFYAFIISGQLFQLVIVVVVVTVQCLRFENEPVSYETHNKVTESRRQVKIKKWQRSR